MARACDETGDLLRSALRGTIFGLHVVTCSVPSDAKSEGIYYISFYCERGNDDSFVAPSQ